MFQKFPGSGSLWELMTKSLKMSDANLKEIGHKRPTFKGAIPISADLAGNGVKVVTRQKDAHVGSSMSQRATRNS